MGSRPSWIKPITMQLVFVASLLSTQLKGVRTKTGSNQDNVSEWSEMFTHRLLF